MWKTPDPGVLEKLEEHGGECAISAHVWHELRYGVNFSTTRDSIAFTSGGLGYGAANTQIILRRGVAADTIAVSRLGRARR